MKGLLEQVRHDEVPEDGLPTVALRHEGQLLAVLLRLSHFAAFVKKKIHEFKPVLARYWFDIEPVYGGNKTVLAAEPELRIDWRT